MLQPVAHGVAQAVAVDSQQLLRRATRRVRCAGAQQLLATAVSQHGAGVAAHPHEGAGAGVQQGAGAGVQQGAGAGVQQAFRRANTRTRAGRAHGSQLDTEAQELQLETVPHEPQFDATAEPQFVQPWPTTTAAAGSGAGTGAGGAASS
ncbi:MAG: hypothetical protein JNL67_01485 [Planctomycetaceae bacterium]|nr:hypothetical protein [Planctomycetaceae bacterium]